MKRWMIFVIMAAGCIAVSFTAFQLKPSVEKSSKIKAPTAKGMVVSVRTVEPAAYAANITALGEVVPQQQITIKSQVEGQVVFISKQLETGNLVKKGELLVRVEQSAFRLQVAEAKNRLAAAKINVLKEEREANEAQTNWQQSGIEGDPVSPLVFHKPQLAASRSEAAAAKASLLHAQTMLGHTEIRAPFDAMIIRRRINPGETLFAADEIATLYGVESVEISVHIDPSKWALLPEPIWTAKVTLSDTSQAASWQASVVRKSYHLVRESRLRTLVLQVQHPLKNTPQLLPGTFVKAEITGRKIPGLLRIPESAFTKQGLVWFVDTENQLRKYRLEPLFYGNGVVYVSAPESTVKNPLLVALSPNSSFVDGLSVQSRPEMGIQDDT